MKYKPSAEIAAVLEIKSLKLPVTIGRETAERKQAQNILFHVKIGLKKQREIKTGTSDFICYQNICERIKKITTQKKFLLIETLAQKIIKNLKEYLPADIYVQVCIHKMHPPIEELEDGVSYTCGDIF